MKKKRIRVSEFFCTLIKIWKVMRLSLCFILFFMAQSWAVESFSQEVRLTMNMKNVKVIDVLNKIENETDYFFLFNQKLVNVDRIVNVEVKQEKVEEILSHLFEGTNVDYIVKDRQIVLVTGTGSEYTVQQQQRTISGTVTSESGEPLPGVSVVIKGTSQGTITDVDGKFTLKEIDSDQILVFSFVGMESKEVTVGNQVLLNVLLIESTIGLEEVVAVGYGVQKKVNLTGAVESVTSEQIASRSVGQASMALQGIAPGVTVTQSSGKPGEDGGTIRIRGIGTIGDSDPLILVDGIPGNINDLDVSEIDNISVLKDAASAAIYGSRAANGVILVTTKRANTGQFQVNYRASAGWQEPTALPKKVNGYDHMVMINEAYSNVGGTKPYNEDYIGAYKINAPSDEYPETNWHDVMLKDRAFQQNHYLGVNGGGEKIRILGSVSYWDQEGIMYSNYKRLNMRLNSDMQIRENLKFGFDLLMKNERSAEPPQQWYWLARYPNNLAGKNENGTWGIGWDGTNGWAELADGGKATTKTDETVANMKLDWQPIKDLNIGFQVAPNKIIQHYKNFRKHVDLYYPDGTIINPSEFKATLTEKYTREVTNNYKLILNYSKNIQSHSFDLLAGWEAIDYKKEWIQGYREQYPLENYEVLDVGAIVNQEATGNAEEWSLMSYFGRVNYNFREKYLFEANLRVDGSSRFDEGNKYGLFPSFSVGWRISEEDFFSTIDWIQNMKLRASWGNLGNQNIGNYPYTSSVSFGQNYIFGDAPVNGAGLINGANPELSWEKTSVVNIGLDATIKNFSITADYYIKNTSDILLELPVSRTAGLTAPYQNAGKVRNTGWDLRIVYSNKINDFNYRIGATLADVKNKIKDLVGTGPYIETRTVYKEGYPINSLYGLEVLGLFQTQDEIDNHVPQFGANLQRGDIKYKDQSVDGSGKGDGEINAADRVVIGSTVPRYTFSFDFTCNYKGLDLGLFFQGVGKVDGYLDNISTMAFYLGGTAQEWHKDYWREDNPGASYPRLTFNYPNNEQVSSYWMRSAAYLRLKNLQVGYTLPSKWVEKFSLNKFRVYFSGQNLFTIDDFYPSYDPEAPVGKGDFYPVMKVFSFGIDASF